MTTSTGDGAAGTGPKLLQRVGDVVATAWWAFYLTVAAFVRGRR